MSVRVYLDWNASAPLRPVAGEAASAALELCGNPSSVHGEGRKIRTLIENSRRDVAALCGAQPASVTFTSGATEGGNLAIKGVYEMYAGKGNHIITVVTEHKAVLDTCKHVEKAGGEVTYLQVKPDGLIDLKELEAAIKPTTIPSRRSSAVRSATRQ